MQEEKVFCPFNSGECSPNCALYVSPEELNEVVRNKLASVGVIDRTKGRSLRKSCYLIFFVYVVPFSLDITMRLAVYIFILIKNRCFSFKLP